MKARVPRPRSKFLEVECRKCKEKVIVFNKSSTQMNCKNCGEELVIPTGGQSYIAGKILKVLD